MANEGWLLPASDIGKYATDYRDMMAKEKPDIAAVCPRWIDQHHDMIAAAAEAGAPVVIETPGPRAGLLADLDYVRAAIKG